MLADYYYEDEPINNMKNLNYSITDFEKYYDYYLNQLEHFAICLLEISNFNTYNYVYGYKYGSILMRSVQRFVQSYVTEGAVLKFRDNTLLIIMDGVKCEDEARTLLETIFNNLSKPKEVHEHRVKLSLKMGAALFTKGIDDAVTILKNSEIALDYAKKNRSNYYSFFRNNMYEEVIANRKMELDILNALNNNEFILYFQPQIDINTMSIYGMEALIRWKHKEYGLLAPSYFIDFIEENEMINEVGRLVIYEACKKLKKCSELGYDNLTVSVNISEKQLEDENFLKYAFDTLSEAEVDPERFIVEITERILVKPSDRILHTLSLLRARGVKIYIDDFGTEYSSLNYLYCLPVDGIKIDKSFIDRITKSKKDKIITRSIIKLAHELDLEVVAEGVEEQEQLKCLKSMACNKIQGFIFAKPLEGNEFINFLSKFNCD